jgi:hypothetical protein
MNAAELLVDVGGIPTSAMIAAMSSTPSSRSWTKRRRNNFNNLPEAVGND